MTGSVAGEGLSLIKQLASCDKSTRDRAVRSLLNTWLPSQTELSDEDMKKLWKGLFFCVWHADKMPYQSDLIEKLSSVLPKLERGLSLQYFSVFLLTMRREWTGIDKLRLDKFYLLIRRFMNFFFAMLKRWSWDLEFTQRSIRVLVDGSFLADDKFPGNGVNYHIASVFLEELRPFLPVQKEVIEILLDPFVGTMGKVSDKILVGKIKSNVFDVFVKMGKRLLELKSSAEEVDEGDDAVVLGTVSLVLGFSTKFYELGSSVDCCQGNRKILLRLHEEFLKLEKEVVSSGIDISIPECDEEEVPELIPIASEMDVDGSNGALEQVEVNADGSVKKASKKSKKVTKVNGGSGKKTKKNKNNECTSADPESDVIVPAESDSFDVEQNGTTALEPVEVNDNGTVEKASKKNKNMKKVAEGSGKKTKKNKNAECISADQENDGMTPAETASSNIEQNGDGDPITFTESVVSNLQLQFEKVAAEVGLDGDVASACDLPKVSGAVSKKRKREKNTDSKKSQNEEQTSREDNEVNETAKSCENSTKRVKFSMKNNLVWKPHSPLPPLSLRIPPSVTPRGSALKPGIPPGPIREMPLTKLRKAKSVRKVRKVKKSMLPQVKRTKKLKSNTP